MSLTIKLNTAIEVKEQIEQLGKRIRSARIRRKLRQIDVAERTGLSLSTIRAIERGEVATGVGAVFQVLWILGLSREIALIADPGLDRDGLALSLCAETKRVFVPRKFDDDF